MVKEGKEGKEKFEKFSVANVSLDLEKVEYNYLKEKRGCVIFDTNFLFVPFEFKVDVVSEIENLVGSTYSFYIYEGTISELVNIEKKGDKNKKFLPLICTMLRRYGFKIIKSEEEYIDDQIVSNISEGDRNVFIATNDKELKMRIKKAGGVGLQIRQKSYLDKF